MKAYLLLISFLSCLSSTSYAQDGLLIQRNDRASAIVQIKPKRAYTFHMDSSRTYHGAVQSYDMEHLTLLTHGKDTVQVLLTSIKAIHRENFYGIFGALSYYAGMFSLFATPIVWARDGGEAALGMLFSAAICVAIMIPMYLLDQRFSYDMVDDWHWKVLMPSEAR